MKEKFTKGPWYRANYSARSAATGKFLAHTDSNALDELVEQPTHWMPLPSYLPA